jgi:7,8-dihydroneopterin aldolase/epimerase/oxygenase
MRQLVLLINVDAWFISSHVVYGRCRSKFLLSVSNDRAGLLTCSVSEQAFCFPLAAFRLSATFGCVDDRIHIEGIEVLAHIGVPDEERATAQRLRFNVTCWPIRPMPELNDEISRAVNYAAVCAELRQFVEPRRDKLIETLADAVGLHLLDKFEIRAVAVELRKYILPEVEFVSVQVTRERSQQ